jgi:tetratricopeptide (TPR) repeat protein
MTALLVTLVLAQTPQVPSRPEWPVRELFEAGRYEELMERVAAAEAPSPDDRYLAGQSALRLKVPDVDRARALFGQLGTEEEDAWTWIGRSAVQLAERHVEEAVAAADQATRLAPERMLAHYQHGLALAAAKRWAEAASAFERATKLDPWFAYAHYHAGMAYYQVKRIDRMVNFLEQFVKLAPEAPERPAVESLLRTVRR